MIPTDTLTLTIDGRTYEIPSPPDRVLKRVAAGYAKNEAVAKGQPVPRHAQRIIDLYAELEVDLDEDLLGPAWEEMFREGVPREVMHRVVGGTMAWVAGHADPDAVQAILDGGASGPKDETSTSTDEDATARSSASGSGTRSRTRKKKS